MADADALLGQLTLEEKVSMLAGSGLWITTPVERLGIPAFKVTDGPNGARGESIGGMTSACFPVGSALASSWNADLVQQVGAALGDEALSKGAQVLLGPTINLHRTPLGGRNFECYGEDPVLSGRLAVAFTNGVQSKGVAACLKHFICNDSEFERHTISSDVDARTLREVYLLPFEMGVTEANAWSVMSSYNRINGVYASSHEELLTDVLKHEWGFDGFVVSDWGAALETVGNAVGGLDLEMPGPARTFGPALVEAVQAGEVPEEVIDDKVRRLLRLMERTGVLDGEPDFSERAEDRPEHRALARQAAAEGMVLIRNERVLPLDRTRIKKLAVIGPNAAAGQVQGGGSSGVAPHYVVEPLEGITASAGDTVEIIHEPGCLTYKYMPAIDPKDLTPATNEDAAGLSYAVYDNREFAGEPVKTGFRKRETVLFGAFDGLELDGPFTVRMEGSYTPQVTGRHEFGLMSAGLSKLYLDDKELIDNWTAQEPGVSFFGNGSTEQTATVDLTAGTPVRLRIDFLSRPDTFIAGLRYGVLPPVEGDLMERAVAAARGADATVLVVGTNDDWETEGNDRTDMALPCDQDALVEAVLAADPNAVVVVNAGAAVSMPWFEQSKALLHTWFPGQEFGNALADLLFGDINPSGRLPTTFPKRMEDIAAYTSYPGEKGRVLYGERMFTGHRWFDARGIEPLVPFGHGLNYTTFAWGELQAPVDAPLDGPVEVALDVTNSGDRAGQEVVQVYVGAREPRMQRPVRELKAFEKVALEPGETKRVTLTLDRRAFAHWDVDLHKWIVDPGPYEIAAGASCRDLRSVATVRLG